MPTDVTVWDWLFSSSSSPLDRFPAHELAGYVNAETKERMSWAQVKEATSFIATALVKEYSFQAGDTITLFSGNTIWYPVAMFSAIRIGGIVSGASPAYNVEEMTYALRTAKTNFLATSMASVGVAVDAAQQAGIPKEHVFLLDGELDGQVSIQDLMKIGKSYGSDGQVRSFQMQTGSSNKEVCGLLCFRSVRRVRCSRIGSLTPTEALEQPDCQKPYVCEKLRFSIR